MSANEQLTTTTNQLNTMFASTIITGEKWSTNISNAANDVTKLSGTINDFVSKNASEMTRVYNVALKEIPTAINTAATVATGGAMSDKGLAKPIDINQIVTIKTDGLDVDFANIIRPIIKEYLDAKLKKTDLKN